MFVATVTGPSWPGLGDDLGLRGFVLLRVEDVVRGSRAGSIWARYTDVSIVDGADQHRPALLVAPGWISVVDHGLPLGLVGLKTQVVLVALRVTRGRWSGSRPDREAVDLEELSGLGLGAVPVMPAELLVDAEEVLHRDPYRVTDVAGGRWRRPPGLDGLVEAVAPVRPSIMRPVNSSTISISPS